MAAMSQTFHKFTGATLDAAYQEMVKSLGERATVVRTTQVARKGLAGLVGGKVYEITATLHEETPKPAGRKLTPAEKRYAKGLTEDNPLPAPRQAYSMLESSLLAQALNLELPPWQAGVDSVLRALRAD